METGTRPRMRKRFKVAQQWSRGGCHRKPFLEDEGPQKECNGIDLSDSQLISRDILIQECGWYIADKVLIA